MRTLRRLVLKLILFLAVLVAAGAIFQAIGLAIDEHIHPPPGTLVDIGGYRLHLYCTGVGMPTVVMDSGLTGSAHSWASVQPAIARTTRVCSYDRAGYGWSDPGPLPRTSDRIVSELHTLLTRAGIKPPYVLVGQSFGGMNVRLYTDRYRRQVAGMVLVDSSYEDQWSAGEGAGGALLLNPCEVATYLGLASIAGQIGLLPRPETGVFYRPGFCTAMFGEIAAIDLSAAEVRSARRSWGALPLIVLSRDFGRNLSPAQAKFARLWGTWQDSLARLSANSRHITVQESGHNIQTDRPGAVIAVVRRVITMVRHGGHV